MAETNWPNVVRTLRSEAAKVQDHANATEVAGNEQRAAALDAAAIVLRILAAALDDGQEE